MSKIRTIGGSISKVVCIVLTACGGGGGGSSVGNYAGTWDISAFRVVNDCGVAIDSSFVTRIVVNQDGERVVVNSGSRVLQGAVNDRDGFTVTDRVPISTSCEGAAAYSFSDASDGEADVGIALLLRCGVRECTVGYGGTATRRDARMLPKVARQETDAQAIYRELERSVASADADTASGTPAESAASLAELVRPVQ